MPVTAPAHQVAVLSVKLRWPRAVDGTAACIGTAAPDLTYAFGGWLGEHGHDLIGVAVWAIPMTLVATALVRWRAAETFFAHVPDVGPFRLHSFRVLSTARPATAITVASASLGALSHILIDAFTHEGRWGSDLLGLDRVLGDVPLRGDFTVARTLQYAGHTVGSLATLALVVAIARRGVLERTYGPETVARARNFELTPRARATFWSALVALTTALSIALASSGSDPLFATLTAGTVATLGTSLLPAARPLATDAAAPG